MSSIDERIVEMEFRNAQFESGVSETLNSIKRLSDGIKNMGKTQGTPLDDLSQATVGFNLDSIASAVENVSSKFNILGAIGFSVINNLTDTFMGMAGKLGDDILGPVITGGRKRAQNLEKAKFQFAGLKMDVEDTMASALAAVEGTAFGLDEAAVAAANFGATGMRAGDEMTAALRGISGVASMSGSSYGEIADVFSKVAGQGRVMGDDLNRLAARGVNAAATLAKQMNLTEGEVRKMVSEGKISFNDFAAAMNDAFGDQATKANETYSGSLANLRAALARVGAKFFTPRLEHMRDMFNAITPVIDAVSKALDPLIDQFIALSGFQSDRVQALFNSFDPTVLAAVAVKLGRTVKYIGIAIMTFLKPIKEAFNETFSGPTIKQIYAFFDALRNFSVSLKMGDESSENLKNTFKGLFSIINILVQILIGAVKYTLAFFGLLSDGPSTILAITGSIGSLIARFNDWLKAGNGIKEMFDFIINSRSAVFGPLIDMAMDVGQAFSNLLKGDPSGFFDKIRASGENLGPLMDGLKENVGRVFDALAQGADNVQAFFKDIGGHAVQPVIAVLEFLEEKFENIRDFFTGEKFNLKIDGIADALTDVEGFQKETGNMLSVWDAFVSTISKVNEALDPVVEYFFEFFGMLFVKIKDYISTLSMDEIIALINAGFFVVLINTIRTYIGAAQSLVEGLEAGFSGFNGIVDSIVGVFNQLTEAIKTMQQDVRANMLLKIAIALGILAAAAYVLAGVDAEDLGKALLAMSAMLGQLMVTLKLFEQFSLVDTDGVVKTGAALVLLGGAVLILAFAMEKISALNWNELAKGLVGTAGLLGALALFTKFGEMGGMSLRGAAGLVILGVAIHILASAVKKLGEIDTADAIQGTLTVIALIGALTGISAVMKNSTGMVQAAVGLLILSASLLALSFTLKFYKNLDWATLTEGLAKMALILVAIGLAMRTMPATMGGSAVALLVVSAALIVLAGALKIMGDQGWDEIAKGLVLLAGGLTVIAAAMILMSGTLAGAAALVVVAFAIGLLLPLLVAMGTLPWDVIIQGLFALAGIFVILAAGGMLLTPVVPTLVLLAVAILAVGAAILLAGVGFGVFASGFALLVTAIVAGFAALVAAFETLLLLAPVMAKQLELALVAFAVAIRDAGPTLVEAMTTVLLSILISIDIMAPRFFDTMGRLVMGMINKINELLPQIQESGIQMLIDLLEGVERNIDDILDVSGRIVVKFINGVEDNLDDIVQAGADLIITFVESLADAIDRNEAAMSDAGLELGGAIVSGMVNGLGAGIAAVSEKARSVAKAALRAAMNVLDIRSPSREFFKLGMYSDQGMADGFDGYSHLVSNASEKVGHDAIFAMKKTISGLSDIVSGEMDANPTITPVLDLSEVRSEARNVGSLFGDNKVGFITPVGKARILEASLRKPKPAHPDDREVGGSKQESSETNYTQIIHSPEAVPPAEIYRQTKSLISTHKGGAFSAKPS